MQVQKNNIIKLHAWIENSCMQFQHSESLVLIDMIHLKKKFKQVSKTLDHEYIT